MATAEFSKFAGILSAALSQHHLATPCPRSGVAAGRSYPLPQARGDGWEEQPHVQGAVAMQAQDGLEEPSQIESQEGRWEEIPLI